jgi:hypothetical protein
MKTRLGLKRKMYRKVGRNVKYTRKYGEREERNKYAKQKTMKQRGWKEETKKRENGYKCKQSNEGKKREKGTEKQRNITLHPTCRSSERVMGASQ